jgi:hypothetical protein
VGEGQPGQDFRRNGWRRCGVPRQRGLFPERDRDQIHLCPVSRRGPRLAGHGGRQHRPDVRSGCKRAATGPQRQHPRLCGNGKGPSRLRAGDSDGGRGRHAGLLHLSLAWAVAAQGNAEGHRDAAERGGARGARRSGGAPAAGRVGTGFAADGSADARGAVRLPQAEIDKWHPIIKAAGIKVE